MYNKPSRIGGHFMGTIEIGRYLIVDPRVCHGKLTFKGTRLPVQTVLTLMAKKGRSMNYIRKSWPHLKREAIEEALHLAAASWPELLQQEVAESIQRLAASLKQDQRPSSANEPAHPRRTA
jgi:uncharacterized protein (DUF433 family)